MDGYTLSHSVEIQIAGIILRGGKPSNDALDKIELKKIHSTVAYDILSAAHKLHKRGLCADVITVGDELEKAGTLDAMYFDGFTGRAALGKIRGDANPKMLATYSQNISDYWGKREIEQVSLDGVAWSRNGRTASAIIDDLSAKLLEIGEKIGNDEQRTLTAAQAASKSYDASVEAAGGKTKYITTGLIDLDAFFRIRRKTLTIIAARPGQGKSALLVTIALNNSREKLKNGSAGKILFLSQEMSSEEVTARFLSQICKVPANRIMDGEMDEGEWARHAEAITEFEKLPILIDDLPALSIPQIRAKARRWLQPADDNVLIVDYIQLSRSGEDGKKRYEEVGAVSRGLKTISSEMDLSVLAAAQLSRAVEQRADKRPMLSDLRESGDIEADANNVIFLHNAESADEPIGIRHIIVAKQRNGATSLEKGDVLATFIAEITRFESVNLRVEKLN